VKENEKWVFEASIQKKKDFAGEVAISMLIQKSEGIIVSNFASFKIPPPQISGLSKIQEQVVIPQASTMMRLVVKGNFAGKLLMLNPKLIMLKTEVSPAAAPAPAVPSVSEPDIRNRDWAL